MLGVWAKRAATVVAEPSLFRRCLLLLTLGLHVKEFSLHRDVVVGDDGHGIIQFTSVVLHVPQTSQHLQDSLDFFRDVELRGGLRRVALLLDKVRMGVGVGGGFAVKQYGNGGETLWEGKTAAAEEGGGVVDVRDVCQVAPRMLLHEERRFRHHLRKEEEKEGGEGKQQKGKMEESRRRRAANTAKERCVCVRACV